MGAKDYRRDFEKVMAAVEKKNDRLQEETVEDLWNRIEADRQAVGMSPKEMIQILRRDGVEALIGEIKRRKSGSK